MDENGHEIPPIVKLANRIGKYDAALENVMDLHDRRLGTPEGPPQFDTSEVDQEQFPQYFEKVQEPVRNLKLTLANVTFTKLLEQRDALADLHTRATQASEGFRHAEEEYLSSEATPEDDKKFELAFDRLKSTQDEIDSVFQGREKQKEDNVEVDHEDKLDQEKLEPEKDYEIVEESNQTDLVTTKEKDLVVLPARIALEEEDMRQLEQIAKSDLSRVPVVRQLEDLAQKVAEIRSGQIPIPKVKDFLTANDRFDTVQKKDLVGTALVALVATEILMPDGSINPRKGLVQVLGREMNNLIAMTTPQIVAEVVSDLPSVEKGLLCASLSVALKEKIGNPDMEFCSAEAAGAYLTNAMYDILRPARLKRIAAQKRAIEKDELEDEKATVTWQDQYHKRDTTMPVEVEDILVTIMERDQREGNAFAQAVIDSIIKRNQENGRSQNSGEQSGILDNLFREMIDYCQDMDVLSELQDFFSSNHATSKYNRIIAHRIDQDRGQHHLEYD
jgi:hypothetical protein